MDHGRAPAQGTGQSRRAVRRRLAPLWLVIVVLIVAGGVGWAYGRMAKDVVILVDNEAPVELRRRVAPGADVLDGAGIARSADDAVSLGLDWPLEPTKERVTERDISVRITAGGRTETVRTTAKTVPDALASVGVEVGDN